MTRPSSRAELAAAAPWVVLAVVAWNGIYDVLLTRGVKEYLFRWALHEAGRGPVVPMAEIMGTTVRDAIWVSSFWAGIIVIVGLATIGMLRRRDGRRVRTCTH